MQMGDVKIRLGPKDEWQFQSIHMIQAWQRKHAYEKIEQ